MQDISKLTTETRNKNTMDLDSMTSLEIASIMNEEDENTVKAVHQALPQIATVIEWCTESLNNSGRIIYMGAGTSGRLGVLDAVECPPTFGTSPDLVVGLIAGGNNAFMKAVEGAEDSNTLGEEDLKAINLTNKDTVIGIAASGRTPYVIYGLKYARKIGCRTAVLVCNKNSEMAEVADIAIEPIPGPEILSGSTRLKAGTVQKMVLNMISTGSMVGIGKVYQNLMVDVMQTNKKLVSRAENIIVEATDCDKKTAEEMLAKADGSVKFAITMILFQCSREEAAERLNRSNGHIRIALNENK